MRKGAAFVCAAALTLAACGEIDQFSPRVSHINDNIARVDADDVVRNVARAANAEPLTFVAVSKVTGSRNADLKLGLPTITIGKHQTFAEKQAVFSGNLLDNSEGYTLELAQLRTDTFTKGLMQPIPTEEFDTLADQGFSRELLMYLLIDSIQLDPGGGSPLLTFRNQPWLDDPATCGDVSFADYFDRWSDPNPPAQLPSDSYVPFGPGGNPPRTCEFHHFQYLVALAIRYGLRMEPDTALPGDTAAPAADMAGPGHGPAGGNGPAPAPLPSEHLCFDRSLANVKVIERLSKGIERKSLCGEPGSHGDGLNINFALVRGPYTTNMHASVRFRSPLAVFQYLGMITRRMTTPPILQDPANAPPGSNRQLFPLTRAGTNCYVRPVYDGRPYCLPDDAFEGKQVVSVLSLLLQTNTNRSDLPTSAVSVQF
jgi:hypothetical protein